MCVSKHYLKFIFALTSIFSVREILHEVYTHHMTNQFFCWFATWADQTFRFE